MISSLQCHHDVIHKICIDLEEELMCYLFFRTENSPLQIYFLELYMEILMQQLLNNNQKTCCCSKFLYVKKLFLSNKRCLAAILQNDRVLRSLHVLYICLWEITFDIRCVQGPVQDYYLNTIP